MHRTPYICIIMCPFKFLKDIQRGFESENAYVLQKLQKLAKLNVFFKCMFLGKNAMAMISISNRPADNIIKLLLYFMVKWNLNNSGKNDILPCFSS